MIDQQSAKAKVRSLIEAGYKVTKGPKAEASTEPYAPQSMTAAELLQAAFPDIRWTIADILPEGIIILASRPKIGKSWFALQVAEGVGSGADVLNRRTSKGSALYLALEDNPRRLQQRLFKHRAGYWADQSALTKITFATEWRNANEGGIEDIAAWLDAHPDARLVVIDTLERFRPKRNERANAYGEDYEALRMLRTLTDSRQVTILIVHHTRKAAADDPLDTISGTLGLGGSADGALVLTRPRGSEQAELHLIGRDVPGEGAYAVTFDRKSCMWKMQGTAAEVTKSRERRDIREVLAKRGPLKPVGIAEEVERPRSTVRKLLRRMLDDGEVLQAEDGTYSIPPLSPSHPTQGEQVEEGEQREQGEQVEIASACDSVPSVVPPCDAVPPVPPVLGVSDSTTERTGS